MRSSLLVAVGLGAIAVAADRVTVNVAPRQTEAPAEVTGCHFHGSDYYCFAGDDEYHVQITPTQTTDLPAEYTDCHTHGDEMFCVDPENNDVEVIKEGDSQGEEGHDHEEGHEEEEEESSGENCHFHAGVEHCGSHGAEGDSSDIDCGLRERDYNIGLRVGLLFVILATSALGVFVPIVLHKFMPNKLNLLFVLLKQFGTGIIISTAFIHLYTHAYMMFSNPCVGDLGYEATTSAVLLGGLFLSFLVEYIGQRIVSAKIRSEAVLSRKERTKALFSSEVVGILVMEAGIVFHSLLIGLTLVVAGDSFFITLFIVILFHQMFEGIALGTRIATIGDSTNIALTSALSHNSSQIATADADADKTTQQADDSSNSSVTAPLTFSMKKKLALAAIFAFITPIGMAIGIGVLDTFNGNDRSTLLAIGTLDAISAGILVWVGVVEMWAGDWMTGSHGHKAELADANLVTVAVAGFGLIAGLVVMSVLGIWA